MKKRLACLLATVSILMFIVFPNISNNAELLDPTHRATSSHDHGVGS